MRFAAHVSTTGLGRGRARMTCLVVACLLMAALGSCSSGPAVREPRGGETAATPVGASRSTGPDHGTPRAVGRVSYSPRVGEVCGLAARESGATVLSCRYGGSGEDSTRLVSSDSEQVLAVRGTSGPSIAFPRGSWRIWLSTWDRDADLARVNVVDARTGAITRRPAGEGPVLAIAASGNQVFVASGNGDVLSLLPTPTEVLGLSGAAYLLAVADGMLWAVDDRGQVSLLDLRTNRASADIGRVPGRPGAGAAILKGRLWVSGSSLVAVDGHGTTQTIDIPGGPVSNVARCAGRLWTAQKDLGAEHGHASGLRAIGADGVVRRTVPAPFPGYLACAGDYLWAATADGRLFRLRAG